MLYDSFVEDFSSPATPHATSTCEGQTPPSPTLPFSPLTLLPLPTNMGFLPPPTRLPESPLTLSSYSSTRVLKCLLNTTHEFPPDSLSKPSKGVKCEAYVESTVKRPATLTRLTPPAATDDPNTRSHISSK